MLAKLTSKNQLTLPKAVVEEIGATEYFEVTTDAGRIVLTPVKIQRADAVREKLAQLHLTEADVAAAVAWARRGGGSAAAGDSPPKAARESARAHRPKRARAPRGA